MSQDNSDEGLFPPVDLDKERSKRGRGRPRTPDVPPPGQDEDYDPDRIYMKASDRHGHSQNVTSAFSKEWLPILHKLAEVVPEFDGSIPAVVRNAVYHYAHGMLEKVADGGFHDMVEQALRVAASEDRAARVENWLKHIEGVEKRLDKLREVGWWDGVADELENFEAWGEGIPGVFRERVERIVEAWRLRLP